MKLSVRYSVRHSLGEAFNQWIYTLFRQWMSDAFRQLRGEGVGVKHLVNGWGIN